MNVPTIEDMKRPDIVAVRAMMAALENVSFLSREAIAHHFDTAADDYLGAARAIMAGVTEKSTVYESSCRIRDQLNDQAQNATRLAELFRDFDY